MPEQPSKPPESARKSIVFYFSDQPLFERLLFYILNPFSPSASSGESRSTSTPLTSKQKAIIAACGIAVVFAAWNFYSYFFNDGTSGGDPTPAQAEAAKQSAEGQIQEMLNQAKQAKANGETQ